MTEQTTPDLDRHSPDYEFRPFPGSPPANAPQKKKRWFKNPLLLIPVAALIVGFSAGASTTPEPVTVTTEVPGPERTVTKEVEKLVTPAACTEYIAVSEEAFGYASEIIGYLGSALSGAADFDTAMVEKAAVDMEVVMPKLEALTPKVNATKAECAAG